MLTLGIDPGTASTGYGLVAEKGDRLLLVKCGVIKTSAGTSPKDRLSIIYKAIKAIIMKHHPEAMAVEKIFFGQNVKTALSVGQARGLALLSAAEYKIPVAEYTPLEVKLAITGYGRADKRQIQQMVKTLLRLPKIPKPDDAADALAIAICHLHSYKIQLSAETSRL